MHPAGDADSSASMRTDSESAACASPSDIELLVRRRLPFHEPESPAAWMGSAVDVRPRVSLSPISSLSEDSDEAAELTGNLDDGTLLREDRREVSHALRTGTEAWCLQRTHGQPASRAWYEARRRTANPRLAMTC